MQRLRTPIQRHFEYIYIYIVGNISLKKFDIFQFLCKKSSIMILDFNFASASREGSDEPVYLYLAGAFAVRIHKIWQQMKTRTKYWPIQTILSK